MGKTYYKLGNIKNSKGESEIQMRLYVSRTIRPHFGTGIWIDAKRWGKKNDINIPTTPGEERDSLIDKKVN